MNMKKILSIVVILLLILSSTIAYAACTGAIPVQAKGLMLSGAFAKSHTYKIAFYTDSATWNSATAQYAATNEVSGSNYTAGGYTLDSLAYGTSGTTYWLDFADEVANNVTFSAPSTCAVIYDSSISNSTCSASATPWPCCSGSNAGTCTNATLWIGTFTSIQPSDGTLTVTFPAATAADAIVRIQ
jgi:hypothetical protein